MHEATAVRAMGGPSYETKNWYQTIQGDIMKKTPVQ